MPENTIITTSPPLNASSSRTSFASCPPEEIRESHAMRDTRDQEEAEESGNASSSAPVAAHDEHVTTLQPTPEPDVTPGATESPLLMEKRHSIDDVSIAADVPSDIGSPEPGVVPSESEARLAESMSTAAISSDSPQPMYMYHGHDGEREKPPPNTTTSFLHPGSKFRGTQQSDRQVYDVQVEIKDVDMTESFLCGYLRIQGLTDDHPTLTTFFEGEIIGPKHLFRTTHPSWGSSEKVDLQHWARFPAWKPLAKFAHKSPAFTLKNFQQREHLFMRWKEYFLVPDHRVKTITGASFEGFYYICFNQCEGSVSGIYFHAKSEKYQQLVLEHVPDNGCVPAIEFR